MTSDGSTIHLRDVLAKAFAVDPAQRYANAREFRHALKPFLNLS